MMHATSSDMFDMSSGDIIDMDESFEEKKTSDAVGGARVTINASRSKFGNQKRKGKHPLPPPSMALDSSMAMMLCQPCGAEESAAKEENFFAASQRTLLRLSFMEE